MSAPAPQPFLSPRNVPLWVSLFLGAVLVALAVTVG
jgi:hypothetical protein